MRRRTMGLLLLLTSTILLCVLLLFMTLMPGRSFRGTPPALTTGQEEIRDRLSRHVQALAGDIGARTYELPDVLQRSRDYIERTLREAGYETAGEIFPEPGIVEEGRYPEPFHNVWADLPGTAPSPEIVVVGAHYDSAHADCPGANDNASGVALVLELARHFRQQRLTHTIRFIAFANEEPPFFQTDLMGSYVHARGAAARGESVRAMIALETLGHFSDAPESQQYPLPVLGWIYPDRGNFVALVSNLSSAGTLRRAVRAFRKRATIPSEGAALPAWVPGVAWSDHWSFWQHGVPAIMLTDTAPFRYPHYHTPRDVPEQIDYVQMARVFEGVTEVIRALSR